jgi:hypothetical protein
MISNLISFGLGFGAGFVTRGLYDDSVSAEVLGLKDGSAYRKFEGAALAGRADLEKTLGKEGARKAPLWTVPGMKEYFPEHIRLATVKSASPKGDVFISANPDAMQFLYEQGLVTEEQARAAGCNVKKPEEPKDELSAAEVEIIQKYRAAQAEKAAKKAEKAA